MKSRKSIVVVGAGFVGLATGVFMARKGHRVRIIEKNRSIVDTLKAGRLHFYEPTLAKQLKSARRSGNPEFAVPSQTAYRNQHFVIIAIDSVDRSTWKMRINSFDDIAEYLGGQKHQRPPVVILKSTNVLGFSRLLRELFDRQRYGKTIPIVVNPEFLREGYAYEDTEHPWRVIVGAEDKKSAVEVTRLYRTVYPQQVPIITTDPMSAELIKLGSNLYLSHRLAFIHEIATFARIHDLDLESVKRGIGSDPRIGLNYFEPGLGFGGSCLPKDCRLINSDETKSTFVFETARTALTINERVLDMLVATLKGKLGSLRGKKIALLGVAFKENLDDTRGSQAIELALKLVRRGAKVAIFDPYLKGEKVTREAGLPLTETVDDALRGASAVVVGTSHRRFGRLNPATVASLVRRKLIADYFGIISRRKWKQSGFEFL